MLVFLRPHVSSRVSGFPVASPCLWGKLHKLSFSIFFNCENWPKSRTKCSFFCAHVSRLESGFPVASPCLWGKLQNLSFLEVSKQVVVLFCVAGVALCDIPTCLITCPKMSEVSKLEEASHEMLVLMPPRVSSRVSGFPVASPCLWGKLQNLSFSKVFKQVVISFCVADVALCDIPTCFIPCRKFFVWLAQQNNTLHTLHSTLYIPHSTLYILHSTLHTPHFTFYTPHSTLLTLHSTLRTLHSTLSTPHSTLYTLPSTLHTPQFTL